METNEFLKALGERPHLTEDRFYQDHWSLLGYMNTIAQDHCGFALLEDCRIRQSWHTLRLLLAVFTKARQPGQRVTQYIDAHHGTKVRTAEGAVSFIPDHDDWDILYEFNAAGYLELPAEGFVPGAIVQFTQRGQQVLNALLEHKRRGGSWRNFTPPTKES